jgi:hypothetical protein
MAEPATEKSHEGGRSVARFNGPGRQQPKMPATKMPVDGRGDNVGSVKPRIAKLGYHRFLTIRDIDGRSRASVRTRQLVKAFETDMGGADRLTTGQQQLVQRAAVLATQLEDFEVRWALGEPIEFLDYLTAINVQRRVLLAIGLERRAKNVSPTLDQYLAAQEAVASEIERDSEGAA